MTTPAPAPSLDTVDAILSHYSKSLQPGESISIPIYKGKATTTSIDLVKSKSVENAAPSKIQSLNEKFPKIAKFIETVENPDFQNTFRGARLYQEDIPKAQADSDDEEDVPGSNPRKNKRKRRKRPAKLHWVLQSDEEFKMNMYIKKVKRKDPEKGAKSEAEARNKLSNRYEGLPESNNSQYVLFSSSQAENGGLAKAQSAPSISVMSTHGFVSFTQPAKFKTLSINEADAAIGSKNVSRYMMHSKLASNERNGSSSTNKNVRGRILDKLLTGNDNDDDADDIMADVAFREQKAGVSAKTRQELLSDFGDGDVKVDYDGTLGGANDSEFAGGRRFGQMKNSAKNRDNADTDKKGKNNSDNAIEDDFYQQDVGAQFENVDCDLDALFDNNDEDMGAGQQDDYDLSGTADVEDDDSDMEEEEELDLGEKSFATKTGMNAIMKGGKNIDVPTSPATATPAATAPVTPAAPSDKKSQVRSVAPPDTPQLDEHGLKIITKDDVRKEIWLHNGSIPTDQLLKKFKANKKKYRDRRAVLFTICQDLCTMEGDILTLKQHYAKM